MRIAVVGAGYVGLVSGACFADYGHSVTCIDLNEEKIDALRNGIIPIYEPGLDDLVKRNSDDGRLTFSTDLSGPVGEADIVLIAVGTPSRKGDGHADLRYVYEVARSVGRAVRGFTVVVTKSTVPVGTGDEIERIIREVGPNAQVVVASNPEFLREGSAIEDFKHPDRVVLGFDDEWARAPLTELYRPLGLEPGQLMCTDRRTAELIKYSANAFLAMKITFINEVADLCEAVGANVQDVSQGIGLDTRIGSKFLNAGPGYGGSCFPKDTLAMAKTGQDHGSPLRLVEATISINDQRKRAMARKVIAAMGGSVRGKTVALLGLTFKPDTDDMRDAPSIDIVQALQDAGAHVRAYDPEGHETARIFLDKVDYAESVADVARGADALVLVTEWDQFRSLDFATLRGLMRNPLLVDLRNVYSGAEVEAYGFRYESIGRPASSRATNMVLAAE